MSKGRQRPTQSVGGTGSIATRQPAITLAFSMSQRFRCRSRWVKCCARGERCECHGAGPPKLEPLTLLTFQMFKDSGATAWMCANVAESFLALLEFAQQVEQLQRSAHFWPKTKHLPCDTLPVSAHLPTARSLPGFSFPG